MRAVRTFLKAGSWFRVLIVVGVVTWALPALAQESATQAAGAADATPEEPEGYSIRRSKTGFVEQPPAFGGANSPEGQLYEADRKRTPAFRFPAIDDTLEPWFDWKKRINEEHGIQLSTSYSTLFQTLNDSLTGEDTGSAGVFRATMRWTLVGRGTKNPGAISMMVDHRHGFRDVTPGGNLASQAGYRGVTGTFFSDEDWKILNFSWKQGFNDGSTGLVVGRYDPNDYLSILGSVNPWKHFSNIAIELDPSVALPDTSWGIGGGQWINNQWYLLGGINDANGSSTDDWEFFSGGAEFFTYTHFGWSPKKSDRYLRNVHVALWHVDEREEKSVDSAQGIALGSNWTFEDRWMVFGRLGWSEGLAPFYNSSATLGVMRKLLYRSDLLGLAANYGSPPDSSLRDQTTIETFWRFQFSQNLAITPSIQLLLNPANNPVDDEVWVAGLRFRFTL